MIRLADYNALIMRHQLDVGWMTLTGNTEPGALTILGVYVQNGDVLVIVNHLNEMRGHGDHYGQDPAGSLRKAALYALVDYLNTVIFAGDQMLAYASTPAILPAEAQRTSYQAFFDQWIQVLSNE